MSWLPVALIPGLLMLATFGLERVEAGLCRDTVSTADVDEFLEQAKASDVDTLARAGMDTALHSIHRRLNERDTPLREDRRGHLRGRFADPRVSAAPREY